MSERTSNTALPLAAPKALPWVLALILAGLGGFGLDLSSPSVDWWPAGLIGTAFIFAALWQQKAGRGFVFGAVAGAAFWMPHISWLTLYLGPVPWAGLCAVMLLWFGLFGMLIALATRGLTQLIRPGGRLVIAQALVAAGLWVTREQIQSTWPYGGFSWGRLAMLQANGPFAELVSWLGFAGLSGLLAFLCALVVAVLTQTRSNLFAKGISLAVIAASALALTLVPTAALATTGTMNVAGVQGNSKSGIFDDRENGDVFRDHLDGTAEMLAELRDEGKTVDLIVWPENGAEFQLPEQRMRSFEVQRLSQLADAPIVAGSVLQHPDNSYTNSSVVFDADGATGQRYDKRRPVPFAEYMPNRAFFRALAPDLVDLVQLEYSFGQLPAVLPLDTAIGEIRAGIAICFDITFDEQAVAMMNGPSKDGSASEAQVILAPTNNADFGHTDESAQQLQIAKLRAIETGRAVVNISTVGTSAIILPDGSFADEITPFTADYVYAEVPLVTGQTPALRFGSVIAGAWIALGLLGAAAGVVGSRRLRAHRSR